MKLNVRNLAFESLVRCEREKRFYNLEINSVIEKNTLSDTDKSFYTALVYTVVEKEYLIDWLLTPFVKMPLSRLDFEVLVLLRLGAAQIFFFDRVPDHSACDETVKLVKASRVRSAAGLVNAVLRSLVREKDSCEKRIESAPVYIKYSMPEWIVSLWEKSYGKEKALEILEGFLKKVPVCIHTNTLKTTPSALLEKILAQGISAHLHPCHDKLIVIDDAVPPTELYGFDSGLFFVQGSASALAVKALSPTPDSLVFDVCACPGGKSFAAALALENRGEIHSFDLHKSKLSLVEKGAKRLGIDIISVEEHDARDEFSSFLGKVDFVIADVPCSGLGVISKKPDIKYKTPDDIKRLPEIQGAILENTSKLLKRGGVLLYSTCTLNRAENEDITNAFLLRHPDFSRKEGYPITYFPLDTTEDGFFVDIIIKD